MDALRIRPEQPGDVDSICAVTSAAFRSAARSSGTEQFIVRALRRAGRLAVSLVAEFDGRVVGHVAASPVTLTDGTPGWYGLGPVSVLPAFQARGVGTQLVRETLAALRTLGAGGCVLVGEPAYYGRFGFRAESRLVLPGVPSQYFQALCLAGDMPAGVVTFDPAFEATA